jgi:hypothetical protein
MTPRHAMLDLETLGKGPRAAIVSIGAVIFDPHGAEPTAPHQRYYARISLESSRAIGLEIDTDTLNWWLGQGPVSRAELANDYGRIEIAEALRGLAWFLNGHNTTDRSSDDLRLWCCGASFDFPILREAYRLCGIEAPWMFYHERDYRTLREMVPACPRPPRATTSHHALHDAFEQARHLQSILRHVPVESLQ